MATVTVYSKCPNDVTFSRFVTTGNEKALSSKAYENITIQVLNKYLHKNGFKIFHPGRLAETVVDKDLWDAIVAERGNADCLLTSKQIFAAKSKGEAEAMLKDAEIGISDVNTGSILKRGSNSKARSVKSIQIF